MNVIDILEPVLTGGIRNTNFFNGRLLAAQDLTDFQIANAQQHRQLGQILGEGVAYGLEVSVATGSTTLQPVLHVKQGLALSRTGDTVSLAVDVNLGLVAQADVTSAAAGLFAECQPPQDTLLTNPGIYILTVMRASALSPEGAPMTQVGNEGIAASCGSRYALEGAKFRTIRLDLGTAPDPASLKGQAAQLATQLDPFLNQLAGASGLALTQLQIQIAPLLSKLRNTLAYLCFGADQFAGFAANPFGRDANGASLFAEYGAVDELRDQNALLDCEVPIALLYWTAAGLQFVDVWSVRRPVIPATASNAWAPLAGGRRAGEGLAMFLQFQAQIGELLRSGLGAAALPSVDANDYFSYLPAAGLLPLSNGSLTGFDYAQFFSNRTYRSPVFIEGAKIEQLVYRSLLYPPISTRQKEMTWLYWVRENMESIAEHTTNAQPYVIFTNGHIPFQGQAQFDLNYWSYANFS